MHKRIIPAILILFLTLFACSAEDSADADGDETDKTGQYGGPCRVNGSCNQGLICLDNTCQFPPSADGDTVEDDVEKEKPECSVNSDCPSTKYCQNQKCVDRPSIDGDIELEYETIDKENADNESTIPDGPILTIFPIMLDFGSVANHAESKRKLLIKNTGNQKLKITAIDLDDNGETNFGDFSFVAPVDTPLDMQPEEQLAIELKFVRKKEGDAISSITFESNDVLFAERTIEMISESKGIVDLSSDPLIVEFGEVPIGEKGTQQILSIWNMAPKNSGGTLKITDIQILSTNADFTFDKDALGIKEKAIEIEPENSFDVPIDATPSEAGLISGSILLFHNDPAKEYPHAVQVNVTGAVPMLEITPKNIDYGPVPLGNEVEQLITLKNTGGVDLEVTTVDFGASRASDFEIVLDPDNDSKDNIPATLEPDKETTVAVKFKPEKIKIYEDQIFISSNSNEEPLHKITVTGTGIPPSLSISPGYLNFGCWQVGETSELPVTISYEGTGEVNIRDVYLIQNTTEFAITEKPTIPFKLPDGTETSKTLKISFTPYEEIPDLPATLRFSIGDSQNNIPFDVKISACALASKISVEYDDTDTFKDVQMRHMDTPTPITDWTEDERAFWLEKETITIKNYGTADPKDATAPLHISFIGADDTSNDQWDTSTDYLKEIPIGESTTFDVFWGPTNTNSQSGKIVICSDAVNSSITHNLCTTTGHYAQIIQFNRTATDPRLNILPQGHDFGELEQHVVETIDFNVSNHQKGNPLTIKSINIEGDSSFIIKNIEDTKYGVEKTDDGWILDAVESAEYLVVTVEFTASNSTTTQEAELIFEHTDKDADKTPGSFTGSAFPFYRVKLQGGSKLNKAPIALIKSPKGNPSGTTEGIQNINVPTDVPIEFDSLDSYDPDGTIQSREWKMEIPGDPPTEPAPGDFVVIGGFESNPTPTIKFNEVGSYTLHLTVTDDKNATNSKTLDSKVEITVQNDPVAIAYTNGKNLTETDGIIGIPIEFDASNSYDQDGTIVAYRWYQKLKDSTEDPEIISTEMKTNYPFKDPGKYEIYLEVEDNDGRISPDRDKVDVDVIGNDYIRIETKWTKGGDVDVHYIRPGGNYGNPVSDCNKNNKTPNWVKDGEYDYGHPEFLVESTDGKNWEIVQHLDPGDGDYLVRFVYSVPTMVTKTKKVCQHYSSNCDICGCSCPPFCWILRICCDSCDKCEDVPYDEVVPAELTINVYLNDETTPKWTRTGEAYKLTENLGTVDLRISREKGIIDVH